MSTWESKPCDNLCSSLSTKVSPCSTISCLGTSLSLPPLALSVSLSCRRFSLTSSLSCVNNTPSLPLCQCFSLFPFPFYVNDVVEFRPGLHGREEVVWRSSSFAPLEVLILFLSWSKLSFWVHVQTAWKKRSPLIHLNKAHPGNAVGVPELCQMTSS